METQEYPLAGLPIKLILGATNFLEHQKQERSSFIIPTVVTASDGADSRPSHLMIIPNTKRHPNNTKMDQLPIFGVVTDRPRSYHNMSMWVVS